MRTPLLPGRLGLYLALQLGLYLGFASPSRAQERQSNSPPSLFTPALQLADSSLAQARLVGVTQDGQLNFEIAGVRRPVAMGQVIRWGNSSWEPAPSWVWMNDGSFLAGQIQWKSADLLELKSEWFQPIELKVESIRGLLVQPVIGNRRFDEWERLMLEHKGASDKIWNTRGEGLSGVLNMQLRPGIDGGPAKSSWKLRSPGLAESVELDEQSLQAIVFSPVLRPESRFHVRSNSNKSETSARIILRDGSRLMASAVEPKAEGTVALKLLDGRTLESLDRAEQFVDGIASIEAEPASVRWLSGLDPARYRHGNEGASGLDWPLGRDRDLFGKPIYAGDQPIAHGLILHAPAQVAYRWDGRAAKLLGEAGLFPGHPSASGRLGSVQLKILVAQEGKLLEIYKSKTMRPGDAAEFFEVELRGAQLLVLIADQADRGPLGDHLLVRDARIVESLLK